MTIDVCSVTLSPLHTVEHLDGGALHHPQAGPLVGRQLDPRELEPGAHTCIVEPQVVQSRLADRDHPPLGRNDQEGDDDRPILRPDAERRLVGRVALLERRDDLLRRPELPRVGGRLAQIPRTAARPSPSGVPQFPARAPAMALK
jgi:hypothetical protein